MAQQFVQAKIKGDKVVLFMKPTCPYCVMAKDVLSKYKFKPGHLEYIDISGRSDMGSIQDYFLTLTGARTVNTHAYTLYFFFALSDKKINVSYRVVHHFGRGRSVML